MTHIPPASTDRFTITFTITLKRSPQQSVRVTRNIDEERQEETHRTPSTAPAGTSDTRSNRKTHLHRRQRLTARRAAGSVVTSPSAAVHSQPSCKAAVPQGQGQQHHRRKHHRYQPLNHALGTPWGLPMTDDLLALCRARSAVPRPPPALGGG